MLRTSEFCAYMFSHLILNFRTAQVLVDLHQHLVTLQDFRMKHFVCTSLLRRLKNIITWNLDPLPSMA